ncbi:hypothetical protein BH10ACI4_BH10ACI4_17530 [soil metagenome]
MRIPLLFILTMLTLPTPAHALPSALYGTYSSYRFIPESGDIIGIELVILPGSPHPNVVFQCAEGAPGETVFAAATVSGNTLDFVVPSENMCGGRYHVSMAKGGIRLTGGTAKQQTVLPRHKSYWAPR